MHIPIFRGPIVGLQDILCTPFISYAASGPRETGRTCRKAFTKIATGDLDAACYRAAGKKKT